MIAFIETIVGDPATWIVTVALAGAALVFRRALSRGVDERFDKRLEEHKHELQLATEAARHAYQRDLADFNLYAKERHRAAASIWAKVRIADGAVGGLFGFGRQLTFEEFNYADMDAYLVSREVPEGQRLRILDVWDTDRKAALAILLPYLRMVDINQAEARFQ